MGAYMVLTKNVQRLLAEEASMGSAKQVPMKMSGGVAASRPDQVYA